MASVTKRFRRKLQEIETRLEAEYPCDSGQAPFQADWAWVLDLDVPSREAPQSQEDDDDIPVQQFQPRTPTRSDGSSGRKALIASVHVSKEKEKKEHSPPLQAPDDAPFAQFNLLQPRPAFHPYLTAAPRWMLAIKPKEPLPVSPSADACDDSLPSIVESIADPLPAMSRSALERRNDAETQASLSHANTDAQSLLTPSAPSTHTNTRSLSTPADSVPLSPRTRRAMDRKKLQQEIQQRHKDRPFEMEVDLTDPSLSTSNATNSAENNDVPRRHTTTHHTTPAPLLPRVDFADMTAVTTPGDNDGDDGDSDIPRTPNKKQRQGPNPPRPSEKRVATSSAARDDRSPSPHINNHIPASSVHVHDTDASLTESHSDTDSESDIPTSAPEAQLTRRRMPTATDKGGGATTTTTRPTLTLTLSAALQREQEAAIRRRIEVPADKLDRLRGQEKQIRARKRREEAARPTQQQEEADKGLNARQKLLLSSTAPTSAPSRRVVPPFSDNNGTSSSTTVKRTVRRNVPIKKPNWSNMSDCLSSWSKWTEEGRQVQKGAQLFHNLVFLLVGTWDKAMAAWVERLVVRGASIVPCYPHEKQHTITHLVSIGIPKPPRKVDCERSLKVDALEDINRGSRLATKFVTQEWIMQCISEERIVNADDPRWKLV